MHARARRLVLAAATALALAAAPAAASPHATADPPGRDGPEPVPLVSVAGEDATARDLLEAGLDVVEVGEDTVLILAHAYERRYLEANGIPFAVVEEDLNRLPEDPGGGAGGLSHHSDRTAYRQLGDYEAELQAIAQAYPGLTRLETIGSSIQQRPIRALEISSAPGAADGRPEHVHLGLHHAREWPSGELALDLAWHLVEHYGTDQRVTDIVDDLRVYVIPVVNPDGFHYSRTVYPLWRKNRNPSGAVDLNRNYSYYWGGPGSSGNPGSQTYRGTAPASEPETRAVRDFFADKHLVTTISGHTHGGWWLFPWGHKYATPPDQELFDLAAASVLHNGYVDGPTASTLYRASGDTTDWAYGTYRSLAFTPEYGTSGSFHPPFTGQGTHQPRVLTAPDDYEGRPMAGSVPLSGESAALVDCGLALSPSDCPSGTAGKIALIERGGDTFANKALNAAARGAIGAVIYNNTSGHINGTLGGVSVPIPVMAILRADGLALLGRMASGPVDATLVTAGAHSYASLWARHLPAFLLNIEAAAGHAARIGGTVRDAVTSAPLGAELSLSLQRWSRTASGTWVPHAHDSSIEVTGSYDWSVLPSRQPEVSTNPYTLEAAAPNYYPQSRTVTLNGYGSTATESFWLQPLAALQAPRGGSAPSTTAGFAFRTFTPTGTAAPMEEVTVTLVDADADADAGAAAWESAERGDTGTLREAGAPGTYRVEVDAAALGSGTYDVVIEFDHEGEAYEYTAPSAVTVP